MNYEEKYKRAFEKAKKLYGKYCINNVLEDLFPELRECKDERIRKGLIKTISSLLDNTILYHTDITKEEALAWLEKQGEKTHAKLGQSEVTKTSDQELEPKFHKGEWIIHQGTENIYQVIARIDNQYQLKYGDNYTVQKCADVDRCARLWNITKDAKDGDVLYLQHEGVEHIIIYKRLFKKNFHTILSVRCAYDGSTNDFFEDVDYYHCITSERDEKEIHPATKEQRDLLFSKMKEAGYEWDAQKKELKKIEVASKESKDERIRKTIYGWIYTQPSEFFDNGFSKEEMLDWLEKQKEPDWVHHCVDLSECSEESRTAYYDGWNNCNMQHSQKENEDNSVIKCLINGMRFYYGDNEDATWGTNKFHMKVADIIKWLEKQEKLNEVTEECERTLCEHLKKKYEL